MKINWFKIIIQFLTKLGPGNAKNVHWDFFILPPSLHTLFVGKDPFLMTTGITPQPV